MVSASYALPSARLSHHGIYANLPHDASLTLYMDPSDLMIDDSTLDISRITRRAWTDVQRCGQSALGGLFIEACEQEDMELDTESIQTLHAADQHGDLGIVVQPNPLPSLQSVLNDTVLHSISLTLKTRTSNGEYREFRWWIAHVSQPESMRARWPIGPGEYVSRAGENKLVPPKTWDGLDAVRLSGCT